MVLLKTFVHKNINIKIQYLLEYIQSIKKQVG